MPVASLNHAVEGGCNRVMRSEAFRVERHKLPHRPVDTAAFVKFPNQQVALSENADDLVVLDDQYRANAPAGHHREHVA